MNDFFKRNCAFLSGVTLVLVAMIIALCVVPKAQLHLALNAYHTPFLDGFFRIYTQFVQWPVYLLMLLPLFFHRPAWTALFAAAEVASVFVIQILKHIFNMPRPLTYFTSLKDSHPDLFEAWQQTLVEGVNLHSWHSFPSGHTATFFIFFAVCALLYSHHNYPHKQLVGILCLVLALIGGYSRIYLSQHFLLDVCVGMAEATLMSCLIFILFLHKNIKGLRT